MAERINLPPCGLFLGSGVYPMSADYLLSTLYAHQSWTPQSVGPLGMIDRIVADNQGNLAQFWGIPRGYAPAMLAEWLYALDEIGVEIPQPDWEHGRYLRPQDCPELQQHADRRGAGILRFIRAAAARDIYTVLIYADAHPQWPPQFAEAGPHYLGYDFGERFTFRLDDEPLQGRDLSDVTLASLADDLVARVRRHVEQRRAGHWGNVYATSSNFHVDYEILGGADIPLIEDFAFCHLHLASALSRGLYRQHNLPLWGSHLAHEHYSWLPNSHPHKFDLLTAALIQKYMAGAKMLINESGNWFVEASLCPDSPKFDFPRVDLDPSEVSWNGAEPPERFAPYIAAAREHYHKIDYDAATPRRYRKVISDFYDFVKAHGTPAGQPETTLAVIKGNHDLCNHRYEPNSAIAGAFALAESNPKWFTGAPERGWTTVRDVFFPLVRVLEPCPNHFLSGTPYGMIDVVSFAGDRITADFLSNHYKALLFCGWNTASELQYEVLAEYVRRGGVLFVSIPHLSTNVTRDYTSYTAGELVRGGDFGELCGVKVTGPGERFYWATAPEGSSELGFAFPRRFGIMGTRLGRISIVDRQAEVLVVDDERARPLLLRRRCGEGTVYFLNSWAYPGALTADDGPGATTDSPGLIGVIYRHIAARARGRTWITDDRVAPGRHCAFLSHSYFPESDTICLHNADFDHPHRCYLHRPGRCDAVELAPGELRMLEAATDGPGARPNSTRLANEISSRYFP